jgi:hypothetical protein
MFIPKPIPSKRNPHLLFRLMDLFYGRGVGTSKSGLCSREEKREGLEDFSFFQQFFWTDLVLILVVLSALKHSPFQKLKESSSRGQTLMHESMLIKVQSPRLFSLLWCFTCPATEPQMND